MLKFGNPPYLEASSVGDKRFSAFGARIAGRGFKSIEEIYQSAKLFADGRLVSNWRDAKGRRALNQDEVSVLYVQLWREYLSENPHLAKVLIAATGISDRFGQAGHNCQAEVLWMLRQDYLDGRSCT